MGSIGSIDVTRNNTSWKVSAELQGRGTTWRDTDRIDSNGATGSELQRHAVKSQQWREIAALPGSDRIRKDTNALWNEEAEVDGNEANRLE